MKIIVTENQIEFIRRYEQIKELVDMGIDVISNDEDFCGYTYGNFIEEVCWQVSDKMKDLNMETETVGTIDKVHGWVRNNFNKHIRTKYKSLLKKLCMGEKLDDVDYIVESKLNKKM